MKIDKESIQTKFIFTLASFCGNSNSLFTSSQGSLIKHRLALFFSFNLIVN